MSGGADTAMRTAKPAPATAAAVELTAEGLQWMLLRAELDITTRTTSALCELSAAATARGATCDVWLNAYDAAPDVVRQALKHSVMTSAAGTLWAPAIRECLRVHNVAPAVCVDPLYALVTATRAAPFATHSAPLSDAAVARLFRAMQHVGLFDAATPRAIARALYDSGSGPVSARAFELLIADRNANATARLNALQRR